MRRAATAALSTLSTAGILALAVPQSADAATGKLAINDKVYENPHGCHEVDARPLRITNQTDRPAIVFGIPHCFGRPLTPVGPGQQKIIGNGASVLIP